MVQSDDDRDEKMLGTIFLIGIVATVVLMVIVSYVGIHINSGKSCGLNYYTSYKGRSLDNSSYVLDNSGDYVLQKFVLNDTNDLAYRFCYDVFVQSNSGVKVNVINGDGDVLGIDYLDNSTSRYCTGLDKAYLGNHNYLGVKCLDCDSDDNVTLLDEITGVQTSQIYSHGGVVTVNVDSTLSYILKGVGSCNYYIKIFTGIYFVLLFALGISVLIVVGYHKFKEILFGDWE